MESVKRSLLFAENYYDVSLQGFYEGVTSSADLADARIALAASKVEYLDSVYSYLVALARLLEVSGLSSDFMLYRSNAVDVVV
jgi:outer membrane protein TolC